MLNIRSFDFKQNRLKNWLANNLLAVVILLLVLVTLLIEPMFLSARNLTNIMLQFGPLSMVSLGMTVCIISGYINLSVAGVFSLAAVVTFLLVDPLGQVLAILVGLVLGCLIGGLTGGLIVSSGSFNSAQALFMTYGISMVCEAIALIISNGATLLMSRDVSGNTSIFQAVGQGTIGIFSVSFILFIALLLILYFVERKTYFGKALKAVGGNKKAAKLAGISIERIIVLVFMIGGLTTAFGGITMLSRTTSAAAKMGFNYETNAILSVVVGGTPLVGGRGSVLNTVLGTLLIILLSNCLNLLGVSTFMQNVFKGLVLVLAIWLDTRKTNRG